MSGPTHFPEDEDNQHDVDGTPPDSDSGSPVNPSDEKQAAEDQTPLASESEGPGESEGLSAAPVPPTRLPASIPVSRPLAGRYTTHRRYARYRRRIVRVRSAGRATTLTVAAWVTSLGILALIATLIAGSVAEAAAFYKVEQPLIAGLHGQVTSKDSVQIFDKNGTLIYEFAKDGLQHSIPISQMPVDLINATVAIEDHTFWTNVGVEPSSIARAGLANLKHDTVVQGGSTITQQLIKSEILGNQVTYTRKLQEIILAFGLTTTHTYTKQQILEMYLNSVGYSPTAYGIDSAANYYFGYKDDPATGMSAAQHLDLAQATILAGIPQNPALNDPLLNFDKARQRQAQVLHSMVQYGYITQAQANQAWAEAGSPKFFHPITSIPNLAPHFVDFIKQQLDTMISTGQVNGLSRSGLRIYTTLDMSMQNQLQKAMKDHLFGNDTTDFAQPTYIRNDNVTNSAGLIADHHTGSIRAYVGSVDYYNTKNDGQFDVVSQGYRSPGSSFKPLVYATAFEKGWFPAMTIGDIPTTFWDSGAGVVYRPLDYDNTQVTGEVTLRTALDWSLNIPAVKVMQYVGGETLKQQVRRMGITKWPQSQNNWGLSTVLGSVDVTPYEVAQAYTVFANYGQFIPLHSIDRITDVSGNVLYQYHVPQPVQVMDPRIAFLITSILTDNASRAGDFGGCSPLYLAPYGGSGKYHYTVNGAYSSSECSYINSHRYLSPKAWPAAAKTGTAQNFTSDWTAGYTMDYTGVVWVGNNNYSPMVNVDGVSAAAPIWYSAMLYSEESQHLQRRAFPVPQGVHMEKYCSNNVCTKDWFLDGVKPPQNIGENGATPPCAAIAPQGGWTYTGKCEIGVVHKTLQNAGAPPDQTKYVGGT
jgi:membrane peptidoglycan carboxypeptidase